MGLKNQFKVAIIGAGNMALEHIKAFRDIPNVEIVGIYSRTKAKAQTLAEQFNINFVADNLDELYHNLKPDLAVVTVYETSMLEVAFACMQYDWTIFLEKPPGYNLDQANQISQAAIKNNRKVLVGLNRRFLSSTQHVMDSLIKQQPDHKRFVTVFDQQSLALAKSLNHEEAVIKHWMYANSIHLVDYVSLLCRGNVTAIKTDKIWQPNTPMVINAFIEFDSGDSALYQAAWEMPGPWAVNVMTADIRWELRPLEKAVYQLKNERQLHPTENHNWDQEFKPGFRLQAEHAVNACHDRNSNSPSMSDAIRTMGIINQIYGV